MNSDSPSSSIIQIMSLKFATQQVQSYQVHTSVYQGPLDLLLQLIDNAELDITKLSLAKVTDQYLQHMKRMQEKVPEEVSAFMVIAAKLIQIKSEALLPRPPRREEGEEDPGDELARQLLAYKRYKEIADLLADRENLGLHTYVRQSAKSFRKMSIDFKGVTVDDLLHIAGQALKKARDEDAVNTVVSRPEVTVDDRIELFTSYLKKKGRVSFFQVLGEGYSRMEVIISFLALLELLKRQFISVAQESLFEDIVLTVKKRDVSGLYD